MLLLPLPSCFLLFCLCVCLPFVVNEDDYNRFVVQSPTYLKVDRIPKVHSVSRNTYGFITQCYTANYNFNLLRNMKVVAYNFLKQTKN